MPQLFHFVLVQPFCLLYFFRLFVLALVTCSHSGCPLHFDLAGLFALLLVFI